MVPACHVWDLLAMAILMAKKRTNSIKSKRTDPAPGQRIPSKRFEGVYYRESKTRKYKGKPDRTYSFTLRDGKKKYINVGRASENKTEELAHQMRLAALTKVHEGGSVETFAEKKTQTLDTLMNAYMDWRKAEGKHTIQEQSRYNKHIKPVFGPMPVNRITLVSLENFKAEKLATLAPASVKKIFILMRAAINHAIARKKFRGTNPVTAQAGFSTPPEANQAERFLSREEAHALLMELEKRSTQLYHMAFIALYSGMRATEIFGLKGADIDENNTVAIITAKGGERQPVLLKKEVLDVLKQYRTTPGALLFPNTKGKRYSDIPDTFERAVNAVGLNDTGEFAIDTKGKRIPVRITDTKYRVIFHTLRHTFASWLAQSGKIEIYELKKLTRHKRFEMVERYAHLIPGEQRKKLTILDKFMPE